MKRKYFTLALAGLVSFALVGTSCGDDDDDAPAPTPVVNPGNDDDDNGNGNGNGNGEEPQAEQNKYIVVHTQNIEKHEWDSQFWFKSNVPFVTGDDWEISLWVKADKKTEGTFAKLDGSGDVNVTALSTQVHNGAGHYLHYQAVGSVTFDTEWKEYKNTGVFSKEMNGGNMICFNLNDYYDANTYYFDQISFKINGVEVVNNGFLETDDYSAFFVKEHQPSDGDVYIDDPITADNVESAPKEAWWKEAPKQSDVPELTEEEKNLKYDTPKVLTFKGQYTAVNIAVKEEWASVSVTFDGKPENVQFCVSSDFVASHESWGDAYQSTYPQIGDDGVGTIDIAAELATMNEKEGDESTKITTIGIQYTAVVEEGTTEFPTAKVLTVVATLKDGTKKLVKGLTAGWNAEVANAEVANAE